jgi:hypothetical protein
MLTVPAIGDVRAVAADEPVVETASGKIRGVVTIPRQSRIGAKISIACFGRRVVVAARANVVAAPASIAGVG